MGSSHFDDGGNDRQRLPGYEGLLAHAMIAAAASDGEISPEQKMRIARQVMKAGIESGHDPRYLHAIANPWTPRMLAEHCESEHHRLAVYQAAVSTANPGSGCAASFMDALYQLLAISRAQRAAFHRARRG